MATSQKAVSAQLHPRDRIPRHGTSPPRTAFVLSGVASLGALQVGMLQALYELAITPDLLVGTSAGALNAAFIASRPQSTAPAQALSHVWRSLQREDIFPVSLSALVGGLCGRRDHLVTDRGLRRLVRRHVEFDYLVDARFPVHRVAFDLSEGREVVALRRTGADSVVAAASIPGVFRPVGIGERPLIDGGVVSNTPISHAIDLGAGRIYALPTADRSYRRPARTPNNALDVAIDGVRLLVDSRLEGDIARYSRHAELIVLSAPNPRQVQPTSFEHAPRLMADARVAARAALRDAGKHLRLAG